MDTAQTLADVGAAYLLNARARADPRDSSKRSHEVVLRNPLTGLPNRTLLRERLNSAGLRGRRSGKMAAVLFVDLDRFKVVNVLYGHCVGDELLVVVAQRLSAILRSGDTLARMSGDEFVVLCEDIAGAEHVEGIAARIGAALAGPFILSGIEVKIRASLGIAFSGRGDRLRESLLGEVDAAMYQAKRKWDAHQQDVDVRDERVAVEGDPLEHELRQATARRGMRTEYQPIVDTRDGRIRDLPRFRAGPNQPRDGFHRI